MGQKRFMPHEKLSWNGRKVGQLKIIKFKFRRGARTYATYRPHPYN